MCFRSLTLALMLGVAAIAPANARDGYADRPMVCSPENIPDGARLARCQAWIRGAMQPRNRGASCCADADAYIASEIKEIGGQLFAVIADGYEGFPHNSMVRIDPEKVNDAALDGGNPTGQIVVFMAGGSNASEYFVYCFFGPTLS